MDNLLYRLNILNDLIKDIRSDHNEIEYIIPMTKAYLQRIAVQIDSNIKILFSYEEINDVIIHNDFLGNTQDDLNYWNIIIDNKDLYENKYERFSYQLCKIKNGIPMLSIIGLPQSQLVYLAKKGIGSFRQWKNLCPKKIKSSPLNNKVLINGNVSLENQNYGILDLIDSLDNVYSEFGVKKMLSIAEGRAKLFPCLYKTKTRETAAAQLICEEAGCSVLETDTKKPLTYHLNKYQNSHFIVMSKN